MGLNLLSCFILVNLLSYIKQINKLILLEAQAFIVGINTKNTSTGNIFDCEPCSIVIQGMTQACNSDFFLLCDQQPFLRATGKDEALKALSTFFIHMTDVYLQSNISINYLLKWLGLCINICNVFDLTTLNNSFKKNTRLKYLRLLNDRRYQKER